MKPRPTRIFESDERGSGRCRAMNLNESMNLSMGLNSFGHCDEYDDV